MKLFIVFILFCLIISCREKEYASIFEYDFSSKNALKNQNFQPIKLGQPSILKEKDVTRQELPDAQKPDEVTSDNWLWKKIGDTMVHYQFRNEKLYQKTIEIKKKGKSYISHDEGRNMFNKFLLQGFIQDSSDLDKKYLIDPFQKQRYRVVVHRRGISLYQYY
jgi:hypothetical protein